MDVQGGRMVSLEPWRFEGTDAITGDSWRISTHPMRRFNGAGAPPIVANGMVVTVAGAGAIGLHVSTTQGNFDLNVAELTYGHWTARLDGRVLADRIPPTRRITATPEEEDFPSAAADRSGAVWVACVTFHHSPHYEELRAARTTPVTDFASLQQPTGGDQIVVRKIDGGAAGPPIEITPAGLDLYRTSLAIDGRERVWVFWSQNNRGNFDVYARPLANGRPGREVQISREAGSDVDAVAATDAKGNVWVAWQGWRNGRAAIYAAVQHGDGFSAPIRVSQSAANEWNPAIAAPRMGA